MNEPVRILVVEDNPGDFRLIERQLARDGMVSRCRRVADLATLTDALATESWDAVLSDYNLPGMDFGEVLTLVQKRDPNLPLVLVSGSVGEERAVGLLKLGAWDFVLKENLGRLVSAVEHGLREAAERHARREAEAALRDSEEKYRTLVEGLKTEYFFYRHDTDGHFTYISPSVTGILGYSPEEFSTHVTAYMTDSPVNRDVAHYTAQSLQGIQPPVYEVEILHRDGSIHRLEVLESPVFDADGKVVAVEGLARDITKRKQAERIQNLSREVLEILNGDGELADSISRILAAVKEGLGCDAVGIRVQEGEDFPYLSQRGFSHDFMLKENSLLVRDAKGGVCREADGTPRLECTCGLVLKGRAGPANPLLTPGGSFWTNDSLASDGLPAEKDPRLHPRDECSHQGYASVALVPIRGKQRILGIMQLNARRKGQFSAEMVAALEEMACHIGETLVRKRAEEALAASERRYRTLFEGGGEGIVVVDAEDQRLLYANLAACRLLGYEREDLLGREVTDICAMGELTGILGRDLRRRNIRAEEVPCRRKDGSVIHVDVSTAPIEFDGRRCVVGFLADVSERRRMAAEKEKLEDQLRQTQKLEAVGSLAGGVAHDFNNLLTGIKGYTELVLDDLAPDCAGREDMEGILDLVNRATDLTRQLLIFSRRQPLRAETLDLNEVVRDQLKMLGRLLRENIRVDFLPDPALGLVEADPGQIGQILMNLAINARDAMPQGGRLLIETSNVDQVVSATTEGGVRNAGAHVLLAVSDEGCGMSKETLERIFEPFFTTKEVGKGTGLGLATVHGIVRQHGGDIRVYSEPGNGTTFRIYLPRVAGGPRTMPEMPAKEAIVPGSGTILLVEDEPSVRLVLARWLGKWGYTVHQAGSPDEAEEVAARIHGPLDLLLTDVVMPGRSGFDLYDSLSAARPGLKAVFMSGYTEESVKWRGSVGEGLLFLEKPIDMENLADCLRQILSGERNGGR